MKIGVIHQGDDVFVVWQPSSVIPDCRGFALLRRRNGIEEIVSTWPGFEFQQAQWTDHTTSPGDRLQYRVLPLMGLDEDNLRPDAEQASAWTQSITISSQVEPAIEALFERCILVAQGMSRRLSTGARSLRNKMLWLAINFPGEPVTG